MPRNVLRLSVAAAVLLAAGVARAGTNTATIAISAKVNAYCTIVTAPITFTAYDPIQSPNPTTTGSVTVSCTKGTDWSVDLDGGLWKGSDAGYGSNRAMADTTGVVAPALPTNYLAYELYTDSGNTLLWTTAGASGHSTTKTLSPSTTIYAKILDGDPAVGSYTDTVTATVNF